MLRRPPDADTRADFTEFVVGSQARLVRFAHLLTQDYGRAEDLVQHAYVKTFASWSKLRRGNPEAYVRQCIINANIDWWRRGTWREQSSDYAPHAPTESSDVAKQNAERDVVMRALGILTKRERAAIALKYYCDLSNDQISREMGVAPATVRTTLFRALAKLRADQQLVKEGMRS